MTPQESREEFIAGLLPEDQLELIRESGLYKPYVEGAISIHDIYKQLKDQAQ